MVESRLITVPITGQYGLLDITRSDLCYKLMPKPTDKDLSTMEQTYE